MRCPPGLQLFRNINLPVRNVSSSSAAVTKVHRTTYCRMYPTIFVQPDGSSIRARYHEPRQIVEIPLDLSTLSAEEKWRRIEARRPKKVVKIEEDLEDSFNAKRYLRFVKK